VEERHWREPDPEDEARINEALLETVPASDAPPWTLGVASKEADMKVRCRTADSVIDEVHGMQRHIAARAQELFRARGGALGHALEDWMKVERDTIWRPALEVRTHVWMPSEKVMLVIRSAAPLASPDAPVSEDAVYARAYAAGDRQPAGSQP